MKTLKALAFATVVGILLSLGYLAEATIAYTIYVAPVYIQFGGGSCLTDGRRNGYHRDWLWGLLPAPWKYTVVCGITEPLIQDFGNQDYHNGFGHKDDPKPISPPGQWQLSHVALKTEPWEVRLYYFSYTQGDGMNLRIGWRKDDIDGFYIFSLSHHRVHPDWDLIWFLIHHNIC